MKCVFIIAVILAYMRSSECSSVVVLSRTMLSMDKVVMEEEVTRELQEDLDDLLQVLMEEWSFLEESEGEDDLPNHQHVSTNLSRFPSFQSSLTQSEDRDQEAEEKHGKEEMFVSETKEVENSNRGTHNTWPAVYSEILAVLQDQNPPVFGRRARNSAGVQAEAESLVKTVGQSAGTAAVAVGTPTLSVLAADVAQGTAKTSPPATVTTEAVAVAGDNGGRRDVRQAPPNILYRRRQQPRPCKRDGSSAVFTGSNAMTYISFLANVLSLVLNINNNVNNNNNNNNINSNNNIDNNNANLNINSNNANQVNIMPPGGKRRRRSVPSRTQQMDASSRAFCSPSYGMVEGVVETAVKAGWRALDVKAGDPGERSGPSGTLLASS